MIIATTYAIMILFGGHAGVFSFDVFKEAVEVGVTDKARAKKIEKVIEAADDEVEAFTEGLKESSEGLLKLTSSYTTTREELNRFLARSNQDRMAFHERLIKLRMQAKDLTMEDEWEAIYAETRANQKKKE